MSDFPYDIPAAARRLLVIAGEAAWCRATAQRMLAAAPPDQVLWLSAAAPPGATALAPRQAAGVLGREFAALVFDAHGGFDADAFGAASGTVRAGGGLLLLIPALAQVEAAGGRFLARLARVIRQDGHRRLFEPGAPLPELAFAPPAPWTAQDECRTADQRLAVEAVENVVHGHRRRPLVITSDRGRGKSAALGIAAARLLRAGARHILVTAPRPEAAEALFRHARATLPAEADAAALEFVAPDELLLHPRAADLLLVDEAAAIPAALLERLLLRHARIVFATTVHGYEGTGRGFALRFHRTLDRLAPGWKALRLETPIRWPADDPLERFTFRALLLDAAAAPREAIAEASAPACTLETLERDALVSDESLLGELFGLLVLAHYRTRPADLRQLLDEPGVRIHAMRHGGHVVATALVIEEGGFDEPTSRAIALGLRRPHGHLLAQSLAAHAGLEQAPRLRHARVMRIAVHPALHRRGLGTRLIEAIAQDAASRGLDCLGASFGAGIEVLRFWQRGGLLPVRLGLTREHTGGTHSAIVLRGLSPAGQALFRAGRARFLDHFPPLLCDALRDLEPALATFLLRQDAAAPPALEPHEWRDAIAFACARRGYEVSLVAVGRLAAAALRDPALEDILDEAARALLVVRVMQRHDWGETARRCGFSGRAQATAALRAAVRALVLHYGDDAVRALAAEVEKDAAADSAIYT